MCMTAPGEGTSFVLYFPASAANQDDPATAPAPLMSEFGALEAMSLDDDDEPCQPKARTSCTWTTMS